MPFTPVVTGAEQGLALGNLRTETKRERERGREREIERGAKVQDAISLCWCDAAQLAHSVYDGVFIHKLILRFHIELSMWSPEMLAYQSSFVVPMLCRQGSVMIHTNAVLPVGRIFVDTFCQGPHQTMMGRLSVSWMNNVFLAQCARFDPPVLDARFFPDVPSA